MKKLFRKKKTSAKKSIDNPVHTVTGCGFDNPFGAINSYIPLHNTQNVLYDTLKEAVPIIDSAIGKLVRLLGTFTVSCKDKTAEKQLDTFLANVKTNGNNSGFSCFISSYFECLLTYGNAVAEILPFQDYSGIYGIYNANQKNILLRADKDNPLLLSVFVQQKNGEITPIKNDNLILLTSLNPKPDKIGGTSVLQGLPFVSGILLKIFHAVGQNWDRAGNIRYAVTYKPPEDTMEVAFTQQRAELIASEWRKAMKDNGVSDFIAVGDVDIKVIGADNQILDCQTPARLITEQIVSKLSIPPFLLGLSWSSTERMSSQQADILTSELEYYRFLLNPVIRKVCRTWLAMNGFSTDFDIVWSNINLQDEVELANARLLNAKARQIEQQSAVGG